MSPGRLLHLPRSAFALLTPAGYVAQAPRALETSAARSDVVLVSQWLNLEQKTFLYCPCNGSTSNFEHLPFPSPSPFPFPFPFPISLSTPLSPQIMCLPCAYV